MQGVVVCNVMIMAVTTYSQGAVKSIVLERVNLVRFETTSACFESSSDSVQ